VSSASLRVSLRASTEEEKKTKGKGKEEKKPEEVRRQVFTSAVRREIRSALEMSCWFFGRAELGLDLVPHSTSFSNNV
jgi:hypothetical protein